MNKTKIIAIAATVVAIACVGLLVGKTNSFRYKVDYLSDRYPVSECKIPWEEFPAWGANLASELELEFGCHLEYEVLQADSWKSFKSLLKTKNRLGEILYDPVVHVIWFSEMEFDELTTNGKMTTWFIHG